MNLALALEGRAKADAEAAPLVALADVLASLPEPEIDENFAAALEARLLTEGLEEQPMPVGRPRLTVVPAEPVEAPAEPLAPVVTLPKRRFVVRRALVASVAAAMLFGAVPVMAAAGSLPGSPFYGIKLRIERAQLALFGDAVADGFATIGFAQRRVAEASQLSALGGDPADVARTLAVAEQLLLSGKQLVLQNTSDPAELSKLASMARETEVEILAIAPAMPQAQDALRAVTDATRAIQADVADALGLPTADAVGGTGIVHTAAITETAKPAATTTTTQPRSETSSSSTWQAPKTDGTVERPSSTDPGTGKTISAPDAGCEVVGSGDGLGDLGAYVTRLTCSPSGS